MKTTHLKHFLNVVIFGLEQLAPGGQVAVGEDAARFQQPVSVTLQKDTQQNTIRLQLHSATMHSMTFKNVCSVMQFK